MKSRLFDRDLFSRKLIASLRSFKRLGCESLEDRQLLAGDLASVEVSTFADDFVEYAPVAKPLLPSLGPIDTESETRTSTYGTQAVADEYTFNYTNDWQLDVLANDVLDDSATDAQVISFRNLPTRNGLDITIADDGQSIVASIQQGAESCPWANDTNFDFALVACWSLESGSSWTFTIPYTIQDSRGVESESFAVVHYEPDVIANGDFERIYAGESISIFPLANDRTNIPATITDVDVTGTRGTVELVTVDSNNPQFQYKAPIDFVGDDSFQYTLASDDGTWTDSATVTLRVEDLADRERAAEYTLEVTDSRGNQVSEVNVGQEFFVSLYVQDTSDVRPQGASSAFADIRFDPSLISAGGEIEFSDNYLDERNGGIDNIDGWVDDVGGVASERRLGAEKNLVARVPFIATNEGTMQLRTNPADDNDRRTFLYGLRRDFLIHDLKYKGATLNIVAASHSADLNGDGAVGPLDALLAINELSSRREDPQSADDRFDVNGDGVFSPLDPLTIINQLPTTAAITKQPVVLPYEVRDDMRSSRTKDFNRRALASDFLYASVGTEFDVAFRHQGIA